MQLEEPIIIAGKNIYNDISKRDHWDLWSIWHDWESEDESSSFNTDGKMNCFKSRKHTDSKWVTLYVERFLKAPIAMPDGTIEERNAGTPQGALCKESYYAK